jgi:hypothetical protein
VAGKVFLVLATIVDLAIAALLIGVSGFVFGGGPESSHEGIVFAAAYSAAVIACVVAPATGFLLNAGAKHGAAQIVAWLPAAVALVVLVIPAL